MRATTQGNEILFLRAEGYREGTVLSGGNPAVVIVVESDEWEYQGHLELSAEVAQILGDELRKAAEKSAQTTLEDQ